MNGQTREVVWGGAAATAIAFLVLLFFETRSPLRRQRESKPRRVARNLTAGGISLAVVTILQTPFLVPAAKWGEQRHFGVLNLMHLSRPVQIGLAIVLLDYTLWIWHRINHVVPFFWRFHLVHHVDRDMDASTAFRFHFGEQALSVGYRIGQIVLLGVDPVSLWIWQGLLAVSVVFHHSNTRLPVALEHALVKVIVTPRMHGIHHSNYRNEANGNWASLFSAWDYLHGTVLLGVPQDAVEIGVPAYGREQDVTLGKILLMPFVKQKEDWIGETGPRVERPHDASQTHDLAQ
ncbi:MAG TPA: sterol desaturase family protein [Thermoanaerobaculia bacterium]|nr:sterol desaturase family protein [Thermoanaerobaculia bacterium]